MTLTITVAEADEYAAKTTGVPGLTFNQLTGLDLRFPNLAPGTNKTWEEAVADALNAHMLNASTSPYEGPALRSQQAISLIERFFPGIQPSRTLDATYASYGLTPGVRGEATTDPVAIARAQAALIGPPAASQGADATMGNGAVAAVGVGVLGFVAIVLLIFALSRG